MTDTQKSLKMITDSFTKFCEDEIKNGMDYKETYNKYKKYFENDNIFEDTFELCYNIARCNSKLANT